MAHDSYVSPFSARYASPEMQFIFSEDNKFKTWRRLWISLAKAEQRQGLPITDAQIAEMEAHAGEINYADAEAQEKKTRHDVMSHVYAFGLQCPLAKPIIHLGATSCYVGDNTDIIVMKQGLELLRGKALKVIQQLRDFAVQYKAVPALAYTHMQPAQPTTVGKRATLWMNELVMDIEEIDHRLSTLALLGSKGTTGTQASFVELLADGDKIDQIERDIAADFGFKNVVPVSGQTYSRKVDFQVLSALSGVAQSASKFSYDLRLLQSFKEMEEPFEKGQIGSSAMAYKRNPMRSERISALSRYVMVDQLNAAMTAGTQWFERTLDDSANRRIAVAEAFLAVDGILNLYMNVTGGLVVYEKGVRARLFRRAAGRIALHDEEFGATRLAGRAVGELSRQAQLADGLRPHCRANTSMLMPGASGLSRSRSTSSWVIRIEAYPSRVICLPTLLTLRCSRRARMVPGEILSR